MLTATGGDELIASGGDECAGGKKDGSKSAPSSSFNAGSDAGKVASEDSSGRAGAV